MPRLDQLKISARIGIACLIPMLAFTGFAVNNLLDKRAAATATANVLTVIETAPSISNLIHEVQRERGASATFVNSKGQALGDVMRNQRGATDKAAEAWKRQIETVDRRGLGQHLRQDLHGGRNRAQFSRLRRPATWTSCRSAARTPCGISRNRSLKSVHRGRARPHHSGPGDDPPGQRLCRAAQTQGNDRTGARQRRARLLHRAVLAATPADADAARRPARSAQSTLFALNALPAQVEAVNAIFKGSGGR